MDGTENIPVTLGFDSTKIIGKAKVNYVKGKGLLCTIEGVDKTLFEGKKIAPMYAVTNLKEKDKIITIEDCKIKGLGTCENHSLDDIPSI